MKPENLKIGRKQERFMVGERDAIHCAVICLEAGEDAFPGNHVYMMDDTRFGVLLEGHSPVGVKDPKSVRPVVGCVDPFLRRPVKKGEFVWVFLFPGSITSLRHVWTHDQFPLREMPNLEAEAKRWVEDWAQMFGSDFDEVMDHADQKINDPNHYWVEGGRFEGMEVPAKFWECYEVLTGKKPQGEYNDQFFSCSC